MEQTTCPLPDKSCSPAAPVPAKAPAARKGFVRRLTLSALLLATAIVLAILEGFLPDLPAFLPPGVKLGLSNIPVMYALLFVRKSDAFVIAAMKSLFVTLTRAPFTGLISLCGGMCALLMMLLLVSLFGEKLSLFLLSITGAVFHNIGQLVCVSLLYQTALWFYLPLLLPAGIATGALTALLLRFISPVFHKIGV